MHRSGIGMADYLWAVGRLNARDPQLCRRIAELLCLTEQSATLSDADGQGIEHNVEAPSAAVPSRAPSDVAVTPQPVLSVEAPLRIESLESERVELTWPDDLPSGPESSETLGPRTPAPPLLAARLERGIVQLLLASERPGRDLDANAALLACARLELDGPLPVRSEWSVHGGCDLLVDVSSALEPFAGDVDRLLLLAEHVGGEATRILYFEQCPGRGVFSEEETYNAYRPERRRTVVVGSFGTSPARMSAGVQEWRAAVQQMLTESEVIGLCPFEQGRADFASLVPMVPWSEATTTNVVTRVLGARAWSSLTS